MISNKQLIFNIILLMFISSGNAFALTCYDPGYGYYNCNNEGYYPDAGPAIMEGALIGIVLGGFNNGNYYQGNNWGGGHGYRGGHGGYGNHGGHGGGGSHGGGHHH